MHEQRRQDQRGHRVRPVEDFVEGIEATAERVRKHAEKRDRQPEEVHRRLVGRSPEADRRADQQREDRHRREQVIEHAAALRNRRKRHVRDLL
jgi:hypothetical protein